MSDQEQPNEANEVVQEPTADEVLAGDLNERFSLELDLHAKWDLGLLAGREQILDVLSYLKAEKGFQILLDITAIDYLSFPGHRGERFAVVYLLRNFKANQRLSVKVMLEEDDARVPTISHLWKNADWLERETFDQYGIQFQGHQNLKRLLNHHEFVGHPLRKDYPAQKRQKLSVNDPMLDQLHARLIHNGYTIVEEAKVEDAVNLGEQS